jgi:SOS-response transcriptional repressor LexA
MIEDSGNLIMVRVNDNGMSTDRIVKGDIVAVDENFRFEEGRIMLIAVLGEVLIRRILLIDGNYIAMPSNPEMEKIKIPVERACIIGTVMSSNFLF